VFAAEFRQRLLEAGASPAEADQAVADLIREDDCLDRLECFKCGVKLNRTLDPRQDGDTSVAGQWFNYRCSAQCGYFVDRVEPVGEN
jgi:hypothetical protein